MKIPSKATFRWLNDKGIWCSTTYDVTEIGEKAFSCCNGLTSVTCLAVQIPTTNTNAFANSNLANVTLYVPSSALEDYKATAPWSGFGTILPLALLGDANGNGEIEIGDVTTILTIMAGN